MINGASGIPCAGREEEYATELWLDQPTAFWLHPEGPLSDRTPDQWRADRAEAEKERQRRGIRQSQMLQAMSLFGSVAQLQAAACYPYQNALASRNGLGNGLLNALGLR